MRIRVRSQGLTVTPAELRAHRSDVRLRLSRFSPVLEEVCVVFERGAHGTMRVRCELKLSEGRTFTTTGIDETSLSAARRAATHAERVLDARRPDPGDAA